MFDDINYRHTAAISRDSWFLRLWCWAWESEPENADFCKLFWGYIFMPLNLVIRVVGYPFYKAFVGLRALKRKIDRRMIAKATPKFNPEERKLEMKKLEESRRKKKNREERWMKFFGAIGSFADKVVTFFQSTWKVTKWALILVAAAACALLAALLVWGIIELGGVIIANAGLIGHILLIAIIVIAGLVVVVGGIASIGFFFAETKGGRAVRRGFDRVFGAFFHAMYMGLVAIKTRTCPKIVLKDEERPTPLRSVP